MRDLPKFVPLQHIMDELSISRSQAYALVRSGQIRAIRVGGRGQWRVSLEEFDAYIARSYEDTERLVHQDSNS
ncbi:helix-turn-helix domain-containing protein [Brachybacterium tyrofermentans]|uniref:helix-turn-helix domain-containing protein n=2 Tax=Brachybacterium tyrofermentans TaxID=47848 RepID=UPI003F90E73C